MGEVGSSLIVAAVLRVRGVEDSPFDLATAVPLVLRVRVVFPFAFAVPLPFFEVDLAEDLVEDFPSVSVLLTLVSLRVRFGGGGIFSASALEAA